MFLLTLYHLIVFEFKLIIWNGLGFDLEDKISEMAQ